MAETTTAAPPEAPTAAPAGAANAPHPPAPPSVAPTGQAAPAMAGSPLDLDWWTTRRCAWLVGLGLGGFWGLAFASFLYAWPGFEPPLPKGKDPDLIMADLWFLLLITAAGCLGATLHALTSFTGYVGNGQFNRSWTLWYLTRPPIGATMALIFMPLVGAGLIPDDVENPDTYAFTLISLGILVGMFSKDATDKLTDVFSAMLASKRDIDRGGKMSVPAPRITTVQPATLTVGSDARQLTLAGSDFLPTTTVLVNGASRRCQIDGVSRITLWLEPEDIQAPGTLTLTPRNADGGRPVDGPPATLPVVA